MTRVGIIGGGQLGRMLALAGHDNGISCTTLDPSRGSPAAAVAPAIVGVYDDHNDSVGGAFVASLDPDAAGWFRDDLTEAERRLAMVG